MHLPNMDRKNFLQVASRLLLRLGSRCSPLREQPHSDDLRRLDLVWTRGDGRRSPRAYPLFQQQDTIIIIFFFLLTYVDGNLVH